MNTRYTPGPWKAIQNPGREPCTYYVVDATGRFCIADLPSGSTCTQANASLVSAGPELLEALRRLSTRFPISPVCGIDAEEWNAAEQARQAIAKATQGA